MLLDALNCSLALETEGDMDQNPRALPENNRIWLCGVADHVAAISALRMVPKGNKRRLLEVKKSMHELFFSVCVCVCVCVCV